MDKFVFVGTGLMTKEDVDNFIKLFEMNKVEAELSHDKSVKQYTLRIEEEDI